MPPKAIQPPGSNQKSGSSASNPPNQTLYCSNLPDKMQKADLRRSLYMLFSTYGPVLDIVALRTMKMRGQAHIVFRDVQASTQAMRALQGFEFFGKEMRITYAKGKSDTIAKLDGTFRIPTAAAPTTSTELQQSIFNAAPGAKASLATPAEKPPEGIKEASVENAPKSPQGVKRPREEEEEGVDDSDVSMEEDDDAMEESDDE